MSITRAARTEEKDASIKKALAYLYRNQQQDGRWTMAGSEQVETAAAAYAFLSQQDKWGDNSVSYQAAVERAVSYLLSAAQTMVVSRRKDGISICPGGVDSCKSVYWRGNGDATYTTGLVAPPLALYGAKAAAGVPATTTGPLAGMSWTEIAQGITNGLSASQTTAAGNRDGGWGPSIPGNGDSDSASTHWAIVSLLYDETLKATTPDPVKDELKVWLGNVESTSGAACFQPGATQCDHADTGGWLLGMKYAGYDLGNPQMLSAIGFLNTGWKVTANTQLDGHFGQPYAMWAVYQGLQAAIGFNDSVHINNLLTDCGGNAGAVPCTWAEDYSQWLVEHQNDQGNWTGYLQWSDPIATSFYINMLGSTEIPLATNSPRHDRPVDRPQVTQQTQRPAVPIVGSGLKARASAAAAGQASPAAPALGKLRPRVRKGVTAVALSPDGSALATASTDDTLRVFNPTNGLQSLVLSGTQSLPTDLVFSPDGATLSSVARDSLVRLWSAASGAQIAAFAGHEQAINALAVSPNGALLASGGEDSKVFLWDLASRKLSKTLFGPTDFVNAVAFSPDSRLMASAGEDARVLIFDVASGKLQFTLLGHSGPIDTLAFSPDGTLLASAGQDTVIHLWNPVQGRQTLALSGHQAPIRTVTFSSDGKTLASGGEDTQIFLWNTATGAVLKILTGSSGAINALVFDPKGRFLVSATDTGEISLWNVSAGIRLFSFTVPSAS